MSQQESGQNVLIPFLERYLEDGCRGVSWLNQEEGIFQISWKKYGTPGWNEDEALIFREWAEHRGRYQQGEKVDWTGWKTNLRNALRKNSRIRELDEHEVRFGDNPYHVYQLVPAYDYVSPRSECSSVSYLDGSTSSCGVSMDIDIPLSMATNVFSLSEEIPGTSSGANELEHSLEPSTITMDGASTENDMPVINLNPPNDVIECEMSASSQILCQTPCQDSKTDDAIRTRPLSINFSSPIELMQGHELNISLCYRGVSVHRQRVTNPNGCRIYYGIGDVLPEVLKLDILCGPPGVDMVKFPDCKNDQLYSNLHCTLSALRRGIVLCSLRGDVYAARKCKITAFYQPAGCTEFLKLQRPKQFERADWVKIFDFNGHYLPTLNRYQREGGMRPKPEFVISFGCVPGPNEQLIDTPISARVVHLKARQLLECSEVHFSSPAISNSDECDHFMDIQEMIYNDVLSLGIE